MAAARPVRRSGAASVALARAEEEQSEGAGIKFALIATSLVLVLALPVCLAAGSSSGAVGTFAKTVVGLFGITL